MSHKSSLIADNIEAYLTAHQHKGLLRFMTCGSVDDGKSSLIGRLLYESKLIFSDQLAALEAESRKRNVAPGELGVKDVSWLTPVGEEMTSGSRRWGAAAAAVASLGENSPKGRGWLRSSRGPEVGAGWGAW